MRLTSRIETSRILSSLAAATVALALAAVPYAAQADSSTNPTIVVKSGAVHVNSRTFSWSKDDSCLESTSATSLVSVTGGSYTKIGTITQVASSKLDSAIIGYGDAKGFSAGIALCPTGSSLGFAFGNVVIGPTEVYLNSAVEAGEAGAHPASTTNSPRWAPASPASPTNSPPGPSTITPPSNKPAPPTTRPTPPRHRRRPDSKSVRICGA